MENYVYDPRTLRLPLISSPTPTALVVIAYLMFVKIIGPLWMRNRKPYKLRTWLLFHNFALMIVNTYMFHGFGKHGWYSKYSWTCANIDFLETEDSLGMVQVSWIYFITKFFELFDTVFFVLRKKDEQITFLHVVHHSMVPLTVWYQIRLGASGYNTLFGFFNTFVHIWMYLYYALAALGPSIQKYLWWKKYLTGLQILQFICMTLAMISVMITPGCKISKRLVASNLGQALFFLVLFVRFYRNSYKAQKKAKLFENGTNHKILAPKEVLNNENGKMFEINKDA